MVVHAAAQVEDQAAAEHAHLKGVQVAEEAAGNVQYQECGYTAEKEVAILLDECRVDQPGCPDRHVESDCGQ